MKVGEGSRRAQSASLAERLGTMVLDLIREGQLQRGDRLPSVRELSERFSVATPTMREALKLLQMAGQVEIRHGSGIYVVDGTRRLLLTNPYVGSLESETILELLAARRLIEPPVTELSARNAPDEALEDLATLLEDAERNLSGDEASDQVLGAVNMKFHRAIAEASGNNVLSEIVYSLTELHIKEQMAVMGIYNNRAHDHEEHKKILHALCSRDASKARDLMAEHLDDVITVVEARLRGEAEGA